MTLADRQSGITLIELLLVVAVISLLAMVGLPVYTDYTVRSKVIADFATARDVQNQVSLFYTINGYLPESNEELGLDPAKQITGNRLAKLQIRENPSPGTIRMVFDSKEALQILGSQKVIRFIPTEAEGTLVWDCTTGTLEDKYRPANCRGS